MRFPEGLCGKAVDFVMDSAIFTCKIRIYTPAHLFIVGLPHQNMSSGRQGVLVVLSLAGSDVPGRAADRQEAFRKHW